MGGVHYTSDELQRIEKMLGQGVRPAEIAMRLGRSVDSIYQATFRYIRTNRTKELRRMERIAARRETAINAFESGLTISELARAFNVSHPAICLMFDRAGLDAEMRDEIRANLSAKRKD